MKPRPLRHPVEKPSRSARKPPRKKPVTTAPRDPLFESLRQELGL